MPSKRPNPSRNATRESGLDLLQAAALACPHGLMLAERGTVKYANPAYARLAGYRRPDDVIGRPVASLAVPKSRSAKKNGHALRAYDTLRFEFAHGRGKVALHVVRDITDRRTLESRLIESEKMEALGRLVGGVAHDFNNILTAITLHSDLLHERNPAGAREVEEIREASRRGAELVRQLLTFARQQPSAPRVVSLRKTIASMSAVVEPLIGEDIELTARFAAERDCVRADPTQLQQVVLNLVMNARDALHRGGRIAIATSSCRLSTHEAARRGLSAGDYVRLTVEDNGIGMKEEVRSRIFEPFFTTKKHGNGTGLGMSMVYGIVNQAGGTVTVATREGKGTRVTVLLPRLAVAQPASAAEGEEVALGGRETVLLAEDDTAVRASVAGLLSARGYHVLQASDGLDAVRTARTFKSPIHLLLSDVVMPRMNGVDAATTVQQLHPEAKVLFMSGYPAKAATVPTPESLLFKPFSRTALEQRVRETLEKRPPVKAAHGHPAVRGTP